MGIISQNVHHVKTEVFSGPLDLLLTLIERKEVDIYKVSLSEIMDEYLEYITSVEWPDIEEAAGFLVIAATLLQIKAKSLLPQARIKQGEEEEEEGVDPELELLRLLIDYKKFKDASVYLKELYEDGSRRYTRWVELDQIRLKYIGNPLEDVTKEQLFEIIVAVSETFDEEFRAIPKITIPIAEKMAELIASLKVKKKVAFSEFVDDANIKETSTVTLVALLELIKNNRLRATQTGLFKEIWISAKGDDSNESNKTAISD